MQEGWLGVHFRVAGGWLGRVESQECLSSVGLQVENLNTAFEVYKEMEEVMRLQADCITYITLMDLCAEARQGQRAVALMQVCFCFVLA